MGTGWAPVWQCWRPRLGLDLVRIKTDSATSPDCATRIAQLGLRNSQDCATPLAQLSGLRNSDCATHRIAQLCLRNCFWQIAQLPGLCNSACATTIARLRNSATTLRPKNSSSHRIWKWRAPSTRARCYQNSHPELQTDLESPQG